MKLKYIPYKIKNWYYNSKWDIITFFQRGKRGWGNRDTWGFDAYLAEVIVGGLKHLKATKRGTPISMYPSELIGNATKEQNEVAAKKWQEAMDTMIKAFELTKDIANQDKELYCPDFKSDTIPMITKEEDDIIKEGFKLFVEHFHNFWD